MSIYVVVLWECCASYVSAWTTEARANEACEELNAVSREKYGREQYEVITSYLQA